MAFTDITLALDLSMTQPGFAALALTNDGQPILLESSHVKTNANRPHGYRLGEISEEIDRYIVAYNPQHIVREKGFSRFPNTTQTIFKAVGISDLYAWMRMEKTIEEIAPTSVKKLTSGDGKAEKDKVERAVLRILQIDNPDFFGSNRGKDKSDAAAVGLAYMYKHGILT